MKILLTLYSTSWGGAETSILDLALSLRKLGCRTHVLFISTYDMSNWLHASPIQPITIKAPMWLYRTFASSIILILCIMFRIQIVNLNWRFVHEESAWLRYFGIRTVATVRAVLDDRASVEKYAKVEAIIGVSDSVTQAVRRFGYKGKMFTVHNGIETDRFKKVTVPGNPLALYSMSRLVAWKRTDWTIRAVSHLRKKGYILTYDIYGDGPEREHLEKLIGELDAEEYMCMKGHRPNNSKELEKYGIFLLPSFVEPFGKTLVENVLKGKVIVASRSGGVTEIMTNYPLLFKHTSFTDYVAKLENAITGFDEYYKDIVERQVAFREYYALERMAKEYYNTYQILLK